MANNTDKIEELEEILRSGITSTNINGTTVTRDLNVIRQQLANLRATDDIQGARKPRVASIDLGTQTGGEIGGQWYGGYQP